MVVKRTRINIRFEIIKFQAFFAWKIMSKLNNPDNTAKPVNSTSGSSLVEKAIASQPTEEARMALDDKVQNQIEYSIFSMLSSLYDVPEWKAKRVKRALGALRGISKKHLEWQIEAKGNGEDEFRYILAKEKVYFQEKFKGSQ